MNELVLEQALFGYEDGHRLLQSSFRLTGYEKDLLLQLSDLAPGISRLREEGYWTGMPLHESSKYALLRTWPAPEKSRPGCVWTHVIIVPFEYLDTEVDWTRLTTRFVRPSSERRLTEYGEKLIFLASDSFSLTVPLRRAEELTSCLYFSKCSSKGDLTQEELGRQAVAIWAQQWPSLRSAFHFRTVEKTSGGRSWLLNFDMMLIDGKLRLQREVHVPVNRLLSLENVSQALAEELTKHNYSDLREFRNTYSEDVPLHPTWTAFLAAIQLHLRDAVRLRSLEAYRSVLESTANALRASLEGHRLKKDLVDFSAENKLGLPFEFAACAIEFLSDSELRSSFPHAKFSDEVAKWMWANDRPKLLTLLSDICSENELVLREFTAQLARTVSSDQLMLGTKDARGVRKLLVTLRPELLRWEGFPGLPASEIAELLDIFTEEEIRSIDIVRELIFTSDLELAKILCERFPGEVVFSVCEGGSYVTHRGQPHEYILRFAGEVASRYATADFISRLNTTTGLLSFVAMLGFVNGITISVGPELWGNALRGARTDSPKPQLQTLQAFALSLALASPNSGTEILFEYGFEPIHEAMRESRLDYQASVIIEPHLPDVGWWHRWDNCYRLRIAVLRAYAWSNLPPQSFRRLARDGRLMGTLFHELESDGDFYQYLQTVRQADSANW